MEALRLNPVDVVEDTLSVAFGWIFQRETDAVGDCAERRSHRYPRLCGQLIGHLLLEAVFALQHVLATDQAAIRVGRLYPIHCRTDAPDRLITKVGGPLGGFRVLLGGQVPIAVARPAPVREGPAGLLLAGGVTLLVGIPLGSKDGRRLSPGVKRLGGSVAGLDALPIPDVLPDLLFARIGGMPGAVLRCAGPPRRVSTLDAAGPGRSGVGRVAVVPVDRHRSSPPWQRSPIVIGNEARGRLVQRHR